jgi:hypothetical protein
MARPEPIRIMVVGSGVGVPQVQVGHAGSTLQDLTDTLKRSIRRSAPRLSGGWGSPAENSVTEKGSIVSVSLPPPLFSGIGNVYSGQTIITVFGSSFCLIVPFCPPALNVSEILLPLPSSPSPANVRLAPGKNICTVPRSAESIIVASRLKPRRVSVTVRVSDVVPAFAVIEPKVSKSKAVNIHGISFIVVSFIIVTSKQASSGRGRDAGHPAPPAQIRTGAD